MGTVCFANGCGHGYGYRVVACVRRDLLLPRKECEWTTGRISPDLAPVPGDDVLALVYRLPAFAACPAARQVACDVDELSVGGGVSCG